MYSSVIIPLFNSTSYLERLVRSLNLQTSRDFSVIFVDDNSDDSPEDALKQLEILFDYDFIKLPSSKAGPGAARNAGIQFSSSEYVTFVDSDDIVSEDYIESLKGKSQESGADIIEGLYVSVDEDLEPLSVPNLAQVLSVRDRFESVLVGEVSRTTWNKFYKLSFLKTNDIGFPEKIENGEDHVFLLKAYFYASSVEIVHQNLYYWIRRRNSLTNKPASMKTVADFFEVSLAKHDLAKRYNDEAVLLEFYKRFFKEGRVLVRSIKESGGEDRRLMVEEFLRRIEEDRWRSAVDYIAANFRGYYDDVVLSNRKYLSFFESA